MSENLLISYDTDTLQRRAKNEGLFKKIEKIYNKVPDAACSNCGDVCCIASPDFYLLEYLYAIRFIRYEIRDENFEVEILRRSLEWSFLNFFKKDVFCPFFMDGKCSIHQARPLNCRLWALEEVDFYEKKKSRALKSLKNQEKYFIENSLKPIKPLEEFILPKCKMIKTENGVRLTQEQIDALDREVDEAHSILVSGNEKKALNYYLHFSGHVLLKKVDPLKYDELKLSIIREYLSEGESSSLLNLLRGYDGRLP